MRRRQYKYKKSRSLLCDVFNNPKSSFCKRPTKPGVHKGKMYSNTYYGELLFQKQRLLSYYCNMKDYQLKNLFKKALLSSDYKQKIIKTLESRLDVLLYRSGLSCSMQEARQIINHKQVLVTLNQKTYVASSPSFLINDNAIITFKPSILDRIKHNQAYNTREVPKHIYFETGTTNLVIQYEYIPLTANSTDLVNISLDNIVSYYKF